jgi:endo-1,4-beta-mannosidase
VGEQEQPFILGVNYWPRRKAMYWWSDFDAGQVQEEFEIVAGLGIGLVRLFLLWEDWQPGPAEVSPGAVLWCYADYVPELWSRPPCDQSRHERFFGLVRPDGSLKPHAEVIRRFVATQPRVRPAQRAVSLDVSPDSYYQDPLAHARRLYQAFLKGRV